MPHNHYRHGATLLIWSDQDIKGCRFVRSYLTCRVWPMPEVLRLFKGERSFRFNTGWHCLSGAPVSTGFVFGGISAYMNYMSIKSIRYELKECGC